jgi:hypothetical protein
MFNEQLVKRLKSFGWRLLCVSLIAGLNWAVQNLSGLELPSWAVAVLGLGLGEITKWLNNNIGLFGKALK